MFQKSSCQLSVLASFPHLEDLDLWGGAFYSDGLGDLLEQIGPTLKKLSLVHVEEMDMKSIAIISVTCPNLIKLNLVNCELEDDQHRMQNPDDPFRFSKLFYFSERYLTNSIFFQRCRSNSPDGKVEGSAKNGRAND